MIPKIIHLTTKNGKLNGDENIILRKNKQIFYGWDFVFMVMMKRSMIV